MRPRQAPKLLRMCSAVPSERLAGSSTSVERVVVCDDRDLRVGQLALVDDDLWWVARHE